MSTLGAWDLLDELARKAGLRVEVLDADLDRSEFGANEFDESLCSSIAVEVTVAEGTEVVSIERWTIRRLRRDERRPARRTGAKNHHSLSRDLRAERCKPHTSPFSGLGPT